MSDRPGPFDGYFADSPASAHGTYTRYGMHCRCDPCKAANAEYGREQRRRRQETVDFRVAAMDPSKHGTKAGYRVGCRCQPCKAAIAAYDRELYQRTKAVVPRSST